MTSSRKAVEAKEIDVLAKQIEIEIMFLGDLYSIDDAQDFIRNLNHDAFARGVVYGLCNTRRMIQNLTIEKAADDPAA